MNRPGSPIRDLDFEDVRVGLADGSIVLVDVREPAELAGGVIPGSLAMPLSCFEPATLPASGALLVFSCAAGVRSRRAVELARAAGLDVDAHYAGGFKGWVASGGPVAAYPS